MLLKTVCAVLVLASLAFAQFSLEMAKASLSADGESMQSRVIRSRALNGTVPIYSAKIIYTVNATVGSNNQSLILIVVREQLEQDSAFADSHELVGFW